MTKHTILITGATGLVGSKLVPALRQLGHEVRILSRKNSSHDPFTFVWDVSKKSIDRKAFERVDTIIHLAGANVAEGRWTDARKKEIVESRTVSTRLLFDYLNTNKTEVTTFISASAIGFYGFEMEEKVFKESDVAGNDFLASVTAQWEKEIDRISAIGIRTVKVRIGIVLAKEGGALKPIASSINKLVGAPLGSGDQFMSWIHIDDLIGIFVHLLQHQELEGPFNAVAPSPITNAQLTRAIAGALHKPLLLPNVPAFVLKLALGQMAEIVLKGSKVSSDRIISTGFQFRYPEIRNAVRNLID